MKYAQLSLSVLHQCFPLPVQFSMSLLPSLLCLYPSMSGECHLFYKDRMNPLHSLLQLFIPVHYFGYFNNTICFLILQQIMLQLEKYAMQSRDSKYQLDPVVRCRKTYLTRRGCTVFLRVLRPKISNLPDRNFYPLKTSHKL